MSGNCTECGEYCLELDENGVCDDCLWEDEQMKSYNERCYRDKYDCDLEDDDTY